MTVVLRITRSQQMALVDVLMTYVRRDEPQIFVDCSNDPETTTTTADLLRLVSDTREIEVTVRAPELPKDILGVLKAQHRAIDTLLATVCSLDRSFVPSKSGAIWDAVVAGNDAILRIEAAQ